MVEGLVSKRESGPPNREAAVDKDEAAVANARMPGALTQQGAAGENLRKGDLSVPRKSAVEVKPMLMKSNHRARKAPSSNRPEVEDAPRKGDLSVRRRSAGEVKPIFRRPQSLPMKSSRHSVGPSQVEGSDELVQANAAPVHIEAQVEKSSPTKLRKSHKRHHTFSMNSTSSLSDLQNEKGADPSLRGHKRGAILGDTIKTGLSRWLSFSGDLPVEKFGEDQSLQDGENGVMQVSKPSRMSLGSHSHPKEAMGPRRNQSTLSRAMSGNGFCCIENLEASTSVVSKQQSHSRATSIGSSTFSHWMGSFSHERSSGLSAPTKPTRSSLGSPRLREVEGPRRMQTSLSKATESGFEKISLTSDVSSQAEKRPKHHRSATLGASSLVRWMSSSHVNDMPEKTHNSQPPSSSHHRATSMGGSAASKRTSHLDGEDIGESKIPWKIRGSKRPHEVAQPLRPSSLRSLTSISDEQEQEESRVTEIQAAGARGEKSNYFTLDTLSGNRNLQTTTRPTELAGTALSHNFFEKSCALDADFASLSPAELGIKALIATEECAKRPVPSAAGNEKHSSSEDIDERGISKQLTSSWVGKEVMRDDFSVSCKNIDCDDHQILASANEHAVDAAKSESERQECEITLKELCDKIATMGQRQSENKDMFMVAVDASPGTTAADDADRKIIRQECNIILEGICDEVESAAQEASKEEVESIAIVSNEQCTDLLTLPVEAHPTHIADEREGQEKRKSMVTTLGTPLRKDSATQSFIDEMQFKVCYRDDGGERAGETRQGELSFAMPLPHVPYSLEGIQSTDEATKKKDSIANHTCYHTLAQDMKNLLTGVKYWFGGFNAGISPSRNAPTVEPNGLDSGFVGLSPHSVVHVTIPSLVRHENIVWYRITPLQSGGPAVASLRRYRQFDEFRAHLQRSNYAAPFGTPGFGEGSVSWNSPFPEKGYIRHVLGAASDQECEARRQALQDWLQEIVRKSSGNARLQNLVCHFLGFHAL